MKATLPLVILACVIVVLFAWMGANIKADRKEESPGQYPLIFYGVPGTDENFRLMREMGVSHVYTRGGSHGFSGLPSDTERMGRIRDYLDMAARHGLRVLFCLDGNRRILRGEEGLEQMRGIVRLFKGHPAVAFWYLHDEPNLPSAKSRKAMLAAQLQEAGGGQDDVAVKEVRNHPESLLPFYKMIKEESPDVPVILMLAAVKDAWWGAVWRDFAGTYDILSFDTYPVFDQPFPQAPLDRVTDWMREYTEGTDKPVMPCLQTFNWNTIKRKVERAQAAGNETSPQWRYPNHEELRYWNFTSFIQGAPGLIYFTFGGGDAKRHPPGEWLEGSLKPATLEIRRFTHLVLPLRMEKLPLSREDSLLAALWRGNGKSYLAVANGKAKKQRITADAILAELNRGEARPWEFTRPDALEAGEKKITALNLDPWEVSVWEVQTQ